MIVAQYLKSCGVESKDAMIGRKWNSRDGEAEIVGEKHREGINYYWVRYEESPNILYWEPKETIERIIKRDETLYDLKIKGIEESRKEKERLAAEKAEKYEDFGFTEGMPAIKRERIIKILNENVKWHGKIGTRKELIIAALNEGMKIKNMIVNNNRKVERALYHQDGRFIPEWLATKTGIDFAEYLINRGK